MLARNSTERTLAMLGMSSAGDIRHDYKRDAEIFVEKAPAEYVYQVRFGAVRSHKLLSDGRRQISAFHLPGDIFGLENDAEHRYTAEAIVYTSVRLVRRATLDEETNNPAVVVDLLKKTTNNLQHAENHMLLLGRKNALEKVAAFLIEMDERMSATASMTLPMSRRDIGDYLGLTVESVSRALAKLRGAGVLKCIGPMKRDVVIVDRQGLAAFDA